MIEQQPFDIRGVKIPLFNLAGGYADLLGGTLNTSVYTPWREVIQQIKADGANNVMLIVSAGVMRNATDSSFDPALQYNPELGAIRAMAELVKASGMSVTISTFANVANVISGDPGNAGQDRPYPLNPQEWLGHYGDSILQWARFAEEIGASSFVPFGDETQHLFRNTSLTDGWLALIDDIHQVFSGSLSTYWWTPGSGDSVSSIPRAVIDQLDYLGIGFFPNLTANANASTQALADSYRHDLHGNDTIQFLRDLHATYDKPIWITDKAFHSFDGAAADEGRIFNASIPLTQDLEEQARLYDSFLQVMTREGGDWLAGVSFQSFNNVDDGSNFLARFTNGPLSESPQGKPAELIMGDWFNGLRQGAGLVETDGYRNSIHIGGYHHDTLSGGLGNDSLKGNAGDDVLIGGPNTLSKVPAYRVDVSLRGVATHDAAPIVKVVDDTSTVVLTEQVDGLFQVGQVTQSGAPTHLSFDVPRLSSFEIVETNWAFFDASFTGNRYVHIESVSVNGMNLDLSRAITYVAPGSYPPVQGAVDSVHGGKFVFDLSRVRVAPIEQSVSDDDWLAGGWGNDTVSGAAGNDTLDGGTGIDTAIYNSARAACTVTRTAAGWGVSSAADGADSLIGIERLKFADATVALDIDGTAGQAYRVYQAAFDRTPDLGGLGFWIHAMDHGASLRQVAEGFVSSAEFKAVYGANPSSEQIVGKMYANVLHRAGEPAGLAFWVDVLDSHRGTAADVLAGFSDSPENQAGLIGVMGNGFAYTPYG